MAADNGPVVYVERKTTFCAAHRFPSTARSDQGHNYTVKVTVRDPVDSVTGMVINVQDLKEYLAEIIDKQFDHKNINKDISWFQNNESSMENVTLYIWRELKRIMTNPNILYEVRVFENQNNFAYYRGR